MPSSLPVKICIVCAGNICRSPIAEAVLAARLAENGLDDQVVVESAGTGGWHAGEPADPRAVRTLHANGYDGSRHRARQFRPSWFDEFDLVLALDNSNLADLERLAPDEPARSKLRLFRSYAPDATGDLDVPDPYYGGDSGFALVLSLVEESVAGLITHLRTDLTSATTPPESRRPRPA
ncbi:low molecular weight protein-tyrosine-phosphatase [Phytoactinopolyspora limicola]|uniref:low molecular weight protein-tyrosine-phosphatase n=1 Tax=Phytoactinopolyspora limicola TaxID=2715536 RepID=UPI00140DE5FA|nr:low molecular weight protein-tyrosine-phosphatase [Phytoactinopolyspora limicola]